MSPDKGGDVELADLLAEAITHETDPNAAAANDHFFEVTLRGLEHAPFLKSSKHVIDYLSETVPVNFKPEWKCRDSITGTPSWSAATLLRQPRLPLDCPQTPSSKSCRISTGKVGFAPL